MDYYVINRSQGVTTLLGGTRQLAPRGQKGDARSIPDWARNHPDVVALEGQRKIRVVTSAEYEAMLSGKPAPVAVAPAPPPVVEPEEEEEVVEVPPPVEEEEEDEVVTEEVTVDEDDEDDALLTVDVFQALKASEQKEYLSTLEVDGDFSNENKRVAAYEEFLGSQA